MSSLTRSRKGFHLTSKWADVRRQDVQHYHAKIPISRQSTHLSKSRKRCLLCLNKAKGLNKSKNGCFRLYLYFTKYNKKGKGYRKIQIVNQKENKIDKWPSILPKSESRVSPAILGERRNGKPPFTKLQTLRSLARFIPCWDMCSLPCPKQHTVISVDQSVWCHVSRLQETNCCCLQSVLAHEHRKV